MTSFVSTHKWLRKNSTASEVTFVSISHLTDLDPSEFLEAEGLTAESVFETCQQIALTGDSASNMVGVVGHLGLFFDLPTPLDE